VISKLYQSRKEAGMKKTIIVLLALFLALPAISFAGSATSRWDMTIGGYVKFDMGWGSQEQGQDAYLAQRKGNGPFVTEADNYGNFYSYAGETRLNFLVKGPDAWGAKTSAFIEGHFRGDSVQNTANAQGTFSLRHAFMQFDWPSSKLIIGQTWQKWGLLPTFANTILGYNELGPFLKGSRQPLVRFEQTIFKNWNWALGLISPTNTLGSNAANGGTGVVDTYTRSQMPFFEGSFGWTSDKCGNIGPWKMLFNLEGYWGRQKPVLVDATIGGVATSYADKNVDSYGIAFKGFIPIIPEKKGNKAGALSVSGILFYTQNPSWFQGGVTVGSYPRPLDNAAVGVAQANIVDWASPVVYGGWGQASYFFTDKFFVNGWFGYMRNNLSQRYINTLPAASAVIQNTTQMILNFSYDVNAAIRFGIEGSYYNTRYATLGPVAVVPGIGAMPTTQKDGSYFTVRVGAFYFF
jgi:hypothetical protein